MLQYDAGKGIPNEHFVFFVTTIFLFCDRGLRPFQVSTFLRRRLEQLGSTARVPEC